MIQYSKQIGSPTSDTLTVPAKTIAYGWGGNDTLSMSVGSVGNSGYNSSVLVGSSGADQYIVANNSTAIILDDGNSAGHIIVATGISFNSDTTLKAEIDQRHLVAHDTLSGQTFIILDWKDPANTIESVQLSDGTFAYDYIVDNVGSSVGYLGSYTLEQAHIQLLGGALADNGITSSSLYSLIDLIKATNSLLSLSGDSLSDLGGLF